MCIKKNKVKSIKKKKIDERNKVKSIKKKKIDKQKNKEEGTNEKKKHLYFFSKFIS